MSIDPSALRVNARRVNVTIPERILDAIDRAAADEHDSRSGLRDCAISMSELKRSAPAHAARLQLLLDTPEG